MNFKTLSQAIKYSPTEVLQFLTNFYLSLDQYHRDLFEAQFRDFFEREGQGITER